MTHKTLPSAIFSNVILYHKTGIIPSGKLNILLRYTRIFSNARKTAPDTTPITAPVTIPAISSTGR